MTEDNEITVQGMSRACNAGRCGDCPDDDPCACWHHEEVRENARATAASSTWRAEWPNHCKSCGGWGVTKCRQGVPYGSTSASFGEIDPCEQCTEKGLCGRCHERGLACVENGDDDIITGEGPCRFCGWNYDDGDPIQ